MCLALWATSTPSPSPSHARYALPPLPTSCTWLPEERVCSCCVSLDSPVGCGGFGVDLLDCQLTFTPPSRIQGTLMTRSLQTRSQLTHTHENALTCTCQNPRRNAALVASGIKPRSTSVSCVPGGASRTPLRPRPAWSAVPVATPAPRARRLAPSAPWDASPLLGQLSANSASREPSLMSREAPGVNPASRDMPRRAAETPNVRPAPRGGSPTPPRPRAHAPPAPLDGTPRTPTTRRAYRVRQAASNPRKAKRRSVWVELDFHANCSLQTRIRKRSFHGSTPPPLAPQLVCESKHFRPGR